VFSIGATLPPFSPKLPSFGQIKNFINTKIDRIKRQKQQASIKALKDELKQQENPFTYRKMLVNRAQKNTVLNSINQFRG
jgi:GTP-binding protein EngB required for normal cell division